MIQTPNEMLQSKDQDLQHVTIFSVTLKYLAQSILTQYGLASVPLS
jgi:hypothetical protein